MKTVGVSIAVPEPYFSALQQMRRDVGDPQAEAVPPHVTLMPPTDLGQSAETTLEALSAHLREVAARTQPFEMILRGTGTFRPVSPVVFVQLAQGVSSCELLEAAVRSGPVERPLEFRYHPHVTIAHHLDEDALDRAFEENKHFEASFVVDAFHLYLQDEDGVWAPVERFALEG